MIRYLASSVQNASGPHVHDPRTGQILESDIQWYHNVMNLLRNWYFVQTAAFHEDARGIEFSDEVMGELIRFVSAHEVGHTIGLQHNMQASRGLSRSSSCARASSARTGWRRRSWTTPASTTSRSRATTRACCP